MTSPLVVPALLLALALAVSAAFKLRDPVTTQDAVASLRLPRLLRASPVPRALPYAELLLAAGLLLAPAPVYPAVTLLVLVLFAAYLVVVQRAVDFDPPVRCGCFGRLGLGEIDRRTVVRNVLFVLLAVVAVADAAAGRSLVGRLTSFGGTDWAWLSAVAVAVVLTAFVLRPTGGREPAPAAAPQPDGELDYVRQPTPYGALRDRGSGDLVPLHDLAAEKPVLLVFVVLGCGPCVRTVESIRQWAPRHPVVRTVLVTTEGAAGPVPDLGADVRWMTDPQDAVARTFRAVPPGAVLLGADGALAGGPVDGPEQVADFLADIDHELTGAGAGPGPAAVATADGATVAGP